MPTRLLTLDILPTRLAIVRLAPDAPMPDWVTGTLVSLTRTASELSVVCAESTVPQTAQAERGWSAMGVTGTLDFGETGILSALAAPLAEANISIFAISTFDTDYVLVRCAQLDAAVAALRAAGFQFLGSE